MVDIPESLQCLFSAELGSRDGEYVLEVPEQEVETGSLKPGGSYRIAVHQQPASIEEYQPDSLPESDPGTGQSKSTPGNKSRQKTQNSPPVAEGDRRALTIESIGSEGDGIAKIDDGYVIIVPGTTPGETVNVEVDTVTDTVAFAETVDAR